MNTLMIVGGGGREHALAVKLSESPEVGRILCVPGNGGTALTEKCENLEIREPEALVLTAVEKKIDLAVIGPEVPLVEGIADRFREAGVPCFGPGAKAAVLEGSKVFAKDFMRRHGVRTAGSRRFSRENLEETLKYLGSAEYPLVIKADGLAAGKGVSICDGPVEAEKVLRALFEEDHLGESGRSVLVEEFLEGREVSVLVLCDGKTALPLLSAMDHKRVGDGDTGPNTGGMGVVAPNPFFTREYEEDFHEHILTPSLRGLRAEGLDFRGVIFFGLMLQEGRCYILEYNVRFGDPETQAVLPLLEDDLFPLLMETAEGRLIKRKLSYRGGAACNVVLASEGYPGTYRKGLPVRLPRELRGFSPGMETPVYIAGAELHDNTLRTSGGRVLSVTGMAEDLPGARRKAYEAVERIEFEGKYYRRDIGAV